MLLEGCVLYGFTGIEYIAKVPEFVYANLKLPVIGPPFKRVFSNSELKPFQIMVRIFKFPVIVFLNFNN